MGDSLRISRKHGVNPTCGLCFWCGESDGTVALLGLLPGDVEAPREMVLNYEPCATCKERFAAGVLIVVVDREPRAYKGIALPPIGKDNAGEDVWPTGDWHLVTEDFIRRSMVRPEAVERVLTMRKCFIPEEMQRQLGLDKMLPTEEQP